MTRDELEREIAEALREASREELLITTDESVWMAEAVLERIWPRLERMETALRGIRPYLHTWVGLDSLGRGRVLAIESLPAVSERLLMQVDAALSPEPSEATP